MLKHSIMNCRSRHGVNLEGLLTWAFEFEDQPYFDGFRDPGHQRHRQAGAELLPDGGTDARQPGQGDQQRRARVDEILRTACAGSPTSTAWPARDREMAVMAWNYHDDDVAAPPRRSRLRSRAFRRGEGRAGAHFRIDETTATLTRCGRNGFAAETDARAVRAAGGSRTARAAGVAAVGSGGKGRGADGVLVAPSGSIVAAVELVACRSASSCLESEPGRGGARPPP